MRWPGESTLEMVVKSTGEEIKQWIEDQMGCEVDIQIISVGMVPVLQEIQEEERCEDVEFSAKPKGKIFQPKYEVWSRFSSIRDQNYRERMGRKLWLSENRRIDEFCANWFRDREISGSKEFWTELDDLFWTAIRKWQAEEIQKWSIEDEDPEVIIMEGKATVNEKIRQWSEEYWRSHPECHQISEERFGNETVIRWG
jgi:hypothetical protein